MTTTGQGSGGARRVFDRDATVDGVLGASGLPSELTERIRAVLSRCWLSKRDKAKAAALLCDRLTQKLGAGQTVQELASELGEPRVVARTLSREVRRNRPLGVRIFRRVVQGVVLVVLLVIGTYGYFFVRFHFGKPNIARNFSQEHNDRVLARPESERAWPLYRKVLPGWKHLTYAEEDGTAGYPDLSPGTPGWDAAVANHKANAAALEAIRQAAKRPAMGYAFRENDDPAVALWAEPTGSTEAGDEPPASVTGNPPLIDVLLPHLSIMRAFGRSLRFDALIGAELGDGRRVTDNLTAVIGLGRQLRDSEVLITDLVATAITSSGLKTLGEILDRYPNVLTDDQLAELALLLKADGNSNPYTVRFTIERQFMLDFLQRSFTDNGNGDGVLVAEGMRFLESKELITDHVKTDLPLKSAVLGPLLSLAVAGRDEQWRHYDAAVTRAEAMAAQPLWERTEHLPLTMHFPGELSGLRFMLSERLTPTFEHSTASGEYLLQERDAVATAIALERFRRARGSYPTKLPELVPGFLAAVPPDRFTGRPLGYALTGGKPRLYSVGADRVDDGGKPAPDQTAVSKWITPFRAAQSMNVKPAPGSRDFRGDWILWPLPPADSETKPSKPPAPSANQEKQ